MRMEEIQMQAEDRERAVKDVINTLKKKSCVCTITDCPFNGLCCLCVRNHRMDGTLPACCLPAIPEKYMVDKYPLCRSPLLWFLIDPEEFVDLYENQLDDETREKIRENIARIYEKIA